MTTTSESLPSLGAVGAPDIDAVGGKAANLGELLRAGIPLPPGFCVAASVYARFVAGSGVQAVLDRELSNSPEAAFADLDECSARIRASFRAEPMPEPVRAAIGAAYRALASDDGPVAVRSSATAEDLPDASFAGQQETYLHVRGVEAVCDAVRECWGSLWTPRAIAYRARQGYRHADVRLAVVVQRMVQPEVSGVLFTVDPMGARHTHMLANASWGLGEAIVSGRVTPDSFTLARVGAPLVSARTLGSKAVRIDGLPEGGTLERDVDSEARGRYCLDDAALAALRDVGLRVERHFGRPQDIEWAFEGAVLHVLQSRPITSLAPEVPDFSKLSRTQRFVLDDILEHFPEAPHPLDYDAVVDTYEQIQKTSRDLGFNAPPADTVITLGDDGLSAVVPRAPRVTLRSLALPWAVLRTLRARPGRWTRHLSPEVNARHDALVARDLRACDDAAVVDFVREASALAGHIGALRFSTVIAPLMLTAAVLGALARLAGQRVSEFEWLAGLAYHTSETELALQGLADHVLARPALQDALRAAGRDAGLAELAVDDPGWAELLQRFLAAYGARTMRLYLPFTARAWAENPAALRATLQAVVRAGQPGAAQARMAAGRQRFEALRTTVVAALPRLLRGAFVRAVERFRGFHVEREATVFQIERAWMQARRGVAEIERRLVARRVLLAQGDALFLRSTELHAALAGELTGASRTVVRRRERRAAAVAYWQRQRVRSDADLPEGTLRGQAGSPGVAEGRVRVVHGPDEFSRLERGEVLVCPFTDPAWTPLFSLACAVVADTGGPLSHAAIVAREYGIPAVLGVQSGTRDLRDGDLVRVDGTRGVVEGDQATPGSSSALRGRSS